MSDLEKENAELKQRISTLEAELASARKAYIDVGNGKWTLETMQIINKLTPDIKEKAFSPDWFLLRQRFEQIENASATFERRIAALEAALGEIRKWAIQCAQWTGNPDGVVVCRLCHSAGYDKDTEVHAERCPVNSDLLTEIAAKQQKEAEKRKALVGAARDVLATTILAPSVEKVLREALAAEEGK